MSEVARMKSNWINTVLLGIIIGLLGWGGNKGFEKMDTLNTFSIEARAAISEIKSKLGEMVTRAQLEGELKKRDETIAAQQKEIAELRRMRIYQPKTP